MSENNASTKRSWSLEQVWRHRQAKTVTMAHNLFEGIYVQAEQGPGCHHAQKALCFQTTGNSPFSISFLFFFFWFPLRSSSDILSEKTL